MAESKESVSEEDALRIAHKTHEEIINTGYEAALDELLRSTADTPSIFKDVLEPLFRMEAEHKIKVESIRCDGGISEEQYRDGFESRLRLELLMRRTK